MSYLIRRVLSKPRLILDEMCRLYGKFASYLRRVFVCKTRLIFPRINGPNDLNQVGRPAVLVKTRVWVGCSVSRAHKTWSRSFLFKDFPLTQPQSDQQAISELPQASVSNRG